MKKWLAGIAGLAMAALLSGCGSIKLTTTKTNYQPSGMVAVVKGETNKNAKVTYTVDGGQQKKAAVKSSGYAVEIAPTTKKQTVKITAKNGGQTTSKTVYVAAAKSLGSYAKIAKNYNQIVTATALPAATQKQLQEQQAQSSSTSKAAAAAQAAQMTAAQKQAMAQQQQALAAQMKAAKQKTADQQLPTNPKNGVSKLLDQKDDKIYGNVENNQLIGATLFIPMKSFKSKTGQKNFGTTFALLAQAFGAKPKEVMKQFSKATKNQKSTQTTMKTIKSNGVKFDTGVATNGIYIYITK
ncbi:hypothetical protein [Lactobacillus selangorensis]|nr:hypothetical protein [Lactobacillus selangorensis]